MPSTTVGTGRHAVRVDTDHLSIDVGDVVRARTRNARVGWRHSGPRPESGRSDVSEATCAEPDIPSVATSRELHVLNVIAPMRRREETLAPAREPGTGTARADRQQCTEDVFRIKTELRTKSATDVWSDEPEFMQRKAKAVGQGASVRMRQLTGRVVRE